MSNNNYNLKTNLYKYSMKINKSAKHLGVDENNGVNSKLKEENIRTSPDIGR